MSIVTRRSFVGAIVVVAAGAAGVTAEFVRRPRRSPHQAGSRSPSSSASPPPLASPLLAQALKRERALLARLDHAASVSPRLRGRLSPLRADHLAHVNALIALIMASGATPTSTVAPTPTASSPPVATATAADVLAWERANAAAAARDCPAATGSAAAILASIYACEQTHVAWLT